MKYFNSTTNNGSAHTNQIIQHPARTINSKHKNAPQTGLNYIPDS